MGIPPHPTPRKRVFQPLFRQKVSHTDNQSGTEGRGSKSSLNLGSQQKTQIFWGISPSLAGHSPAKGRSQETGKGFQNSILDSPFSRTLKAGETQAVHHELSSPTKGDLHKLPGA